MCKRASGVHRYLALDCRAAQEKASHHARKTAQFLLPVSRHLRVHTGVGAWLMGLVASHVSIQGQACSGVSCTCAEACSHVPAREAHLRYADQRC